MLHASAKSVREERSKHRYALQDCSLIRATLVRGRAGWKVTGSEAIQNFYSEQSTREGRKLIREIIRLLRRLIHGEESHLGIFDETKRCLVKDHPGQEEVTLLLYTLRVLHALGYIRETDELAPMLRHEFPYDEGMHSEADFRTRYESVIRHAFEQSHL